MHDLLVDFVALDGPPGHAGWTAMAGGEPDRAVERDPALEPAVGETLASAAGLPDAFLRLIPVLAEQVDDAGGGLPAVVSKRAQRSARSSSGSMRAAIALVRYLRCARCISRQGRSAGGCRRVLLSAVLAQDLRRMLILEPRSCNRRARAMRHDVSDRGAIGPAGLRKLCARRRKRTHHLNDIGDARR